MKGTVICMMCSKEVSPRAATEQWTQEADGTEHFDGFVCKPCDGDEPEDSEDD